jgi:hypothetical protein
MIYMNDTEVNMIARLRMAKHEVVNLGKLVNYDFYHMEHYHPLTLRSSTTHRKVNPQQPFANPDRINPNGLNWGLVQYQIEKVRYTPDKNKDEILISDRLASKWLDFLTLLAVSGVQIAGDGIVKPIMTGYALWKRRVHVIRKTVRDQSLVRWPWLISGLLLGNIRRRNRFK